MARSSPCSEAEVAWPPAQQRPDRSPRSRNTGTRPACLRVCWPLQLPTGMAPGRLSGGCAAGGGTPVPSCDGHVGARGGRAWLSRSSATLAARRVPGAGQAQAGRRPVACLPGTARPVRVGGLTLGSACGGRRGASPAVHEVGDDGGEQAEQHDGCAGVHHGVQELPWVLGQGEHSLQILEGAERAHVSGVAGKPPAWSSHWVLPEASPCKAPEAFSEPGALGWASAEAATLPRPGQTLLRGSAHAGVWGGLRVELPSGRLCGGLHGAPAALGGFPWWLSAIGRPHDSRETSGVCPWCQGASAESDNRGAWPAPEASNGVLAQTQR